MGTLRRDKEVNKEVMDCTVSVYSLGIREGFKRAANLLREDIVKRGKVEELHEVTEYFASLLLVQAGPTK